ncbi:hypothetical protein BOTBODRAFT_33404 [Botryobasidium botryosum FD-172 SS1]|uniref:Uncharacterized protein n=1 Tax=Botryobasidium botryosum (strain FD-172 SS1) TaxID=930990 RepID=A0A067MD67_BOTB1|nr:hypothetical protein BOTBODRAFT_33404 [Botryobasidium botryosum FD-172 SS1]
MSSPELSAEPGKSKGAFRPWKLVWVLTAAQSRARERTASSGPPLTHPQLENTYAGKSTQISSRHHFVCQDGVNAARLLHIARDKLLKKVMELGGNAIVAEEWNYNIKKRGIIAKDEHKVSITYSGKMVTSSAADPHQPVALDKAVVEIPGLMTIKSHEIV